MDPRGALGKLGHPGGFGAAVRTLAVPGTAAAVGARLLPNTLVLTQWLPDATLDIRDIPGVCRWRGPVNDRREVALTFDDAPDPRSTVETLRALERLELRATFFCLGRSAQRDGGLVREICARGHEIAAHGYEHERHVAHSRRWVKRDVARSADLLEGLGVRPAFFRPSYGLVTGARASQPGSDRAAPRQRRRFPTGNGRPCPVGARAGVRSARRAGSRGGDDVGARLEVRAARGARAFRSATPPGSSTSRPRLRTDRASVGTRRLRAGDPQVLPRQHR